MAIQQAPRAPLLEEAMGPGGPIVVFDNVSLAFDDKEILRHISFTLKTGHTKVFLGASGAGKSTILRLILGLLKPDDGRIFVNGERVDDMREDDLMKVRGDLGMVFQEGALFDSLTVRENVGYKLFEESSVPMDEVNRRVEEVLGFVRLSEFIDRMPSELSGGQRRRVAVAMVRRELVMRSGTGVSDLDWTTGGEEHRSESSTATDPSDPSLSKRVSAPSSKSKRVSASSTGPPGLWRYW
jgi:ABC-type sugar transport system ATPase subunit